MLIRVRKSFQDGEKNGRRGHGVRMSGYEEQLSLVEVEGHSLGNRERTKTLTCT